MENMTIVDWTGYLASALLMVSFTMKDVTKLRSINSLGCIAFVVYGFMLDSWPVIITNAFILCMNIWFLITLRKKS